MGTANVDQLVIHFQKFVTTLPPVPGPQRLRVGDDLGERCLVLQEISATTLAATEDRLNGVTQRLFQWTAFLYAAGATALVWRRSAGLLAAALTIQNRFQDALPFVILGNEHNLLEAFPTAMGPAVETLTLWHLVRPSDRLPATRVTGSLHNAWQGLAVSVPARDHVRTEQHLASIANVWLREYGEEYWSLYDPYEDVAFDPAACAAAKLAHRSGMEPASWSPAVADWYRAGMESEDPEPLFL